MKRAAICALTAAMLVGNTLSVNAAGLKDIFDAEYYAEQYPDLKEAFGDNEEALYQHFLTYGLKEGRNMSPILDVQEYRAKYADLEAAFGDDWEAYVEHFFAYGVKEKRDNGTDFDLNAYLEAYADLREAFGTDYLSAAKHYMTCGIKENRQEASKEYVWQREVAAAAAAKAAEEAAKEETTEEKFTGEKRIDIGYGGLLYRIEYYENGNIMKATAMGANGTIARIYEYEYDTNGVRTRYFVYSYVGGTRVEIKSEYNAAGKIQWEEHYNIFGDVTMERVHKYDENGNHIGYTRYDYDSEGKRGTGTDYDLKGNIIS